MLEIGTKVIDKASNEKGIIASTYNKGEYPMGYEVITNDGVHHICLEEDFVVIE